MRTPFTEVEGKLHIDQASAEQIAGSYGTPLYVYSEKRIADNYDRLKDAIRRVHPRSRILYAAKANTNLAILRLLRRLGSEIDAVSPGETYLALKAGFRPDQILFTGTSVSDEEMRWLVEKGVRLNLDSRSQLKRLLRFHVPDTLSFRVNPELGAGHHEHVITAGAQAKFGVWDQDAVEAYSEAAEAGVKRFGVQMHIGSGISDVRHYVRAAGRMMEIVAKVHERLGVKFEFIDLGGGIGVPYKPGEEELDLDVFLGELAGFVKEKVEVYGLGDPELWLEPGRYIVADAGVLLTRATTLKDNPFRRYVGVDAGFNTLVRPIMYGSYHEILNASNLNGEEGVYDVYGPLCESGDVFARDRPIPHPKEGDLLAIMNAGAYGFSMSSQYNSRPRAAEVMVLGGEASLVRNRESLEDLVRGMP
jgi:diaminopimelate decarboxylase